MELIKLDITEADSNHFSFLFPKGELDPLVPVTLFVEHGIHPDHSCITHSEITAYINGDKYPLPSLDLLHEHGQSHHTTVGKLVFAICDSLAMRSTISKLIAIY